MDPRTVRSRFSLMMICILAPGVGEGVIQLRAQSIALPQFEEASIKPSVPGNLRGSTFEFLPGSGLRIINGTLRAILETAYEVREFQTLGRPGCDCKRCWHSGSSSKSIVKQESFPSMPWR